MQRQPGRAALTWLEQDPHGASLLRTAHALLAIDAVLATVLPASLARHTCAASLEEATLILRVPGPAHAARLRQLTKAAADALTQAGYTVRQIVVRIDAGVYANGLQKLRHEAQPLDASALQCFEVLKDRVAPGPLADAISRLLRRHRP